jgi:hypothetical protein
MVNYEKITEAELDQYLALSYLPFRKEKVNFSDRHNFISLLVSRLKLFGLLEEFGENIICFLTLEASHEKQTLPDDEKLLVVEVFCADIRLMKMAALKCYHENIDTIKEKIKKMGSKSPYDRTESVE